MKNRFVLPFGHRAYEHRFSGCLKMKDADYTAVCTCRQRIGCDFAFQSETFAKPIFSTDAGGFPVRPFSIDWAIRKPLQLKIMQI